MTLKKESVIIEELEIENDILKERLNELNEKNKQYNNEITLLRKDVKNKEDVINTILNSKTFRYADKIGKFLKGSKK